MRPDSNFPLPQACVLGHLCSCCCASISLTPASMGCSLLGSAHISELLIGVEDITPKLSRRAPGGSGGAAPLPPASQGRCSLTAGCSWHGEKSGSYCAGAFLKRECHAQFISFKETQPEGIIRASLRTQSHTVYPTQIKKRGPQENGAGEIKKRSAPRRVSLLPDTPGPLRCSVFWQKSHGLPSTGGCAGLL